jgi:hypothetical protein
MSGTRDWTAGLVGLTSVETRVRLGELYSACRTRSCEIAGFQGQGLADEVSSSERRLRLAAQEEIRHLATCIVEYGTPFPDEAPAPAATVEPPPEPEPEAAPAPVEAAPPAPQPDPVPAYLPPARGTRPTLPLRPVRVPPRRPA